MTTLHYDAETFSECDLKPAGLYRYAEHPSTELLCMTYLFDDGPAALWIPLEDHEIPRDVLLGLRRRTSAVIIITSRNVPHDLRTHVEAGGEVRAFNAQFERVVMNGVAGQKLDFPHVKIEQTVCVQAKCAAAGLPRALGDAATALGTHAKDDGGRISMLQISKPRKPTKADPSTRWTIDNAPEKYLDVYVYNVDDVLAECGVDAAVPELTSHEQKVYWLDQRINERGVGVDRPGVAVVQELIAEYKGFLELAMEKATRDDDGFSPATPGLKPTQREKIADWIRANGWPNLLDMQAETVKALVARTDVPDNVKHVLRIYSTYNAKAVTKFDAIEAAVCADGRLRGMFTYHGANTGRWSSTIVQLQNLFRPVIDDPETAVAAFRSKSLEWIKALYPDVDFMKVAASTVRTHLVAAPGKKLVCLDFAGVESRANAWAWGEQWKLDAFRAYDEGRGPDLYIIAVCDVLGLDPRGMKKKDPRRQWGKVIDLFGQYEGGVGAFVNLADQYGVDLEEIAAAVWPTATEEELSSATWMWEKFGKQNELAQRTYMSCDIVKQRWRRKHAGTAAGWKELRSAAELAVQFKGQTYPFAKGKGMFKVVPGAKGHEWLCMLLPARRRMLRYYKPEWTPPKTVVTIETVIDYDGVKRQQEFEREIPGELHYMGVDTVTRRYMRTSSYGGSWNNNFVQGMCADLLRDGMFEMEGAGYPIVLTVHDENGAEVDEAFGSVAEAAALMCAPKPWFAGLPLVAEGFQAIRYRK